MANELTVGLFTKPVDKSQVTMPERDVYVIAAFELVFFRHGLKYNAFVLQMFESVNLVVCKSNRWALLLLSRM